MNIAQDEYYTPILLSVPATGENSPAFLSTLADALCEETDLSPAPSLIIHTPAVALATAAAGDRRTLMNSLAGWIKKGRLTVWNAGYAGAAVDLLNDEEFSREREWATANPWKYGFGMLSSKTGGRTAFAAAAAGRGAAPGTEVPSSAEAPGPAVATRNAMRLLSVPRYFPLRIRIDQARKLRDYGGAVCLGYASPPRQGMVSELVLVTDSAPEGRTNTTVIRARYLVLEPAFAAAGHSKDDGERDGSGVSSSSTSIPPATTGHPVEVNHVVLPRGISEATDVREIADAIRRMIAEAASAPLRRGTEHRLTERDITTDIPVHFSSSSQPEPLTCHSGVDPYAPEREPAVLATLARLRERGETGNTAMRRILCAAGDRAPIGRRVVQAVEIDDRAPLPHPPPHDRELQGGSSGSLTIQEGTLRVSFFGGRINGLSANGEPPPQERRAQGFFRRSAAPVAGSNPTTGFLETAFAAWFTGSHTRGNQEHASLGKGIAVESTAVMVEGFPALLFGQRVTTAEPISPDMTALSVFELPLCSVAALDTIAVECTGNGSDPAGQRNIVGHHSIDIAALRAAEPQDLPISARHVVLDLPQGALRISVAARAADMRVPFRFAVVPKAGVATLVFRTVPYLNAPAVTRLPAGRTWTVSYLFSPASVSVDRIVITPEIAAETHGFTYTGVASPRSR